MTDTEFYDEIVRLAAYEFSELMSPRDLSLFEEFVDHGEITVAVEHCLGILKDNNVAPSKLLELCGRYFHAEVAARVS